MGTLSVGAKDALWGMILGVMPEDGDTLGDQGGRNHLGGSRQAGLIIPIEFDGRLGQIWQNGVRVDAMIGYKLLRW